MTGQASPPLLSGPTARGKRAMDPDAVIVRPFSPECPFSRMGERRNQTR
jgi:hypothetical protein